MTRRSLATVSSTSRSSPTWSHASLCTTSSHEATVWTRSRAAAPRCPSLRGGPHGCLQCRRLLGCSGHRIRRRRHHAIQLIVHLKPNLLLE
ncbi:tie-dyed2 [Zea mays]|uniref:Tie-dyed2 n=1 Tax=Zea mays TaxID=4577 RepID=A0A1D6HQC6_MAIZE|nr:tie-dyed2 [Zea mays]